ncbi:MAG: serine hydrolase [Saprospiraceae bacterium]
MKNLLLLLLSLLALTSTSLNAQEILLNTELSNKIDTYLSAGISKGFSGSVLVMKESQIILNKGYGLADRENNLAYISTTVAPIGSVTKQFTAAAILKLEEYGKLKTTDRISQFFKDIPLDKEEITIHQLLTHTAGFIDQIGDSDFNEIPQKKFFKAAFSSILQNNPGEKYAYSNVGYSILARIIEVASGMDYELFLHENIFKPAGMEQTGYFFPTWKENSIAKGYAHGVINVGSMIERYQKMDKVTWSLKGHGGIHSTSEDMYKWHEALNSNTVLSQPSFERLTTRYVKETEAGTSYYGYGWAIYESNRNTKIISHNGGNSIYFHDFIWSPEEDALVILFTNAASKEVEVAWRIEKMLFDEAYVPTPIKKNLHLLVIDFMETRILSESQELADLIEKEYLPEGSQPNTLNSVGYDILRHETDNNTEWAIELFKLNVKLFPKDGNSWDSLGEAYLRNEQKELAIISYQTALDLAPTSNCSWCKSSTEAIERLRKTK